MGIVNKSTAGVNQMFKTLYGDYGNVLYGTGKEDVLEGLMNKKYDLKGNEKKMAIRTTFGGSTAFGSLPDANNSKTVNPVIDAKSAYARIRIDRKTMKQGVGDKAVFKDITKDEVESKVKSFTRTQAWTLYNDGTGIMGQFSGNATGSATDPVITILTTGLYGFRSAFFEEGDLIQVRQSGTTLLADEFEIVEVNTDTRAITLKRLTGSTNLTSIGSGTHDVVLNKSLNSAPIGVMSLFNFSSGNLYGVPFQRRFSSYKLALANTPLIDVSHFNKAVLAMDQRAGKAPDFIVCSTNQMEKLLNNGENQKKFINTSVAGNSVKVSGKTYNLSYSGVSYESSKGNIDIVSSRYVRDDMVILGSKEHLQRHHTEDFGWFDDDGTILMREPNSDSYEARYGGYYENYLNPFYFGFISGLNVQ